MSMWSSCAGDAADADADDGGDDEEEDGDDDDDDNSGEEKRVMGERRMGGASGRGLVSDCRLFVESWLMSGQTSGAGAGAGDDQDL